MTAILDRLGIAVSAACLIHCATLPLIIAAAPSASRLLGLPEELHLWLFAAAVPISTVATVRGYRHHGATLPMILGLLGLVLLGAGLIAEIKPAAETGLSLAGSCTLAFAHMRNWQLRTRPLATS